MRALLKMVDLLSKDPAHPVGLAKIARQERIPEQFIKQIFVKLRRSGIVRSVRGVEGGFFFAKPLDLITVGQVMRILDGPVDPIPCVSQSGYAKCTCADETTCGFRIVMLEAKKRLTELFEHYSLLALANDVRDRRRASFSALDSSQDYYQI